MNSGLRVNEAERFNELQREGQIIYSIVYDKIFLIPFNID